MASMTIYNIFKVSDLFKVCVHLNQDTHHLFLYIVTLVLASDKLKHQYRFFSSVVGLEFVVGAMIPYRMLACGTCLICFCGCKPIWCQHILLHAYVAMDIRM